MCVKVDRLLCSLFSRRFPLVVVVFVTRSALVTATYQPPITDKPLIVLVNKRTASASEIVAGALKDNCRASLVGDQATFGKGLIQSVYELSDGSGLIVTVGKYVTPAQVDIDKHGISTNFKSIPTLEQQQEYIAACKLKTTL